MTSERIDSYGVLMWWKEIKEDRLWYLIGLIASDGCLSSDGRHIDITSTDYELLKVLKTKCNLKQSIGKKHNGRGNIAYRIQIGSKTFYQFLLEVGLTPKKSKTIGPLCVPQTQFPNFLRGEIDGDGCIRRWVHPGNGGEQWSLRIVSASRVFLEWIQQESETIFRVRGRIHRDEDDGFLKYVLKYGKMAAQVILARCYSRSDLVLQRKYEFACACVNAKGGWTRSKTIG